MGQTVIALSECARIQCIPGDQLLKHSIQEGEQELKGCLKIERGELEKEQMEEKQGRQILTFHLLRKDNGSLKAFPLSHTSLYYSSLMQLI